jgi:hypothetical protein
MIDDEFEESQREYDIANDVENNEDDHNNPSNLLTEESMLKDLFTHYDRLANTRLRLHIPMIGSLLISLYRISEFVNRSEEKVKLRITEKSLKLEIVKAGNVKLFSILMENIYIQFFTEQRVYDLYVNFDEFLHLLNYANQSIHNIYMDVDELYSNRLFVQRNIEEDNSEMSVINCTYIFIVETPESSISIDEAPVIIFKIGRSEVKENLIQFMKYYTETFKEGGFIQFIKLSDNSSPYILFNLFRKDGETMKFRQEFRFKSPDIEFQYGAKDYSLDNREDFIYNMIDILKFMRDLYSTKKLEFVLLQFALYHSGALEISFRIGYKTVTGIFPVIVT